MRYCWITLLALLLAVPAAAQEWQVAREQFAFVGNRLTIRVDADVAGTLRVIRGAPGSVRVASRADRGFTAAGLADHDELTLTAAGARAVDYLIAVPEEVWVRVRLPGGSFGESVAGHTRSRSFEWGHPAEEGWASTHQGWGSERPSSPPGATWAPPLDDRALFTSVVRGRTPQVVRLPDLANIRSVTVRLQEGLFRVLTTRPLSVEKGSDDRMEIRPASPPMDVILTVPPDTPEFRLVTGGQTALLVQADSVTVLCSPLTQQWLSNGRRWLTFNPVDGALRCADRPTPRHEG